MVSLVLILLVALVIMVYGVSLYNGLILLKNNIDKAWSNIDVLLKQRHDEIPKLIKVCEGYMSHEKGVFDRVMKAREAMMSARGPAAAGRMEGELERSLKQLFALAENYPDLKAQASFGQLQSRISGLESNIADRREFYNESVNTYNIRIESIPDIIVARSLGYTKRELFKVDAADREDVKIEFKS